MPTEDSLQPNPIFQAHHPVEWKLLIISDAAPPITYHYPSEQELAQAFEALFLSAESNEIHVFWAEEASLVVQRFSGEKRYKSLAVFGLRKAEEAQSLEL